MECVVELAKVGLRKAAVKLDLVDGRYDVSPVEKARQVRDGEVRDSDGAHTPVVVQPLERLPRLDVSVALRRRPMNQVEVDDVETEQLLAVVERAQRRVVAMVGVPHLGGDEQLIAWDAAVTNGTANAFFVVVQRCRVDEAIAGVQ